MTIKHLQLNPSKTTLNSISFVFCLSEKWFIIKSDLLNKRNEFISQSLHKNVLRDVLNVFRWEHSEFIQNLLFHKT